MPIRSLILLVALGVPGVGLLLFGPRHTHQVPSDRTVIRYWEKWSGVEGDAMRAIVDRFNDTAGAQAGIWVDYCAVSNVDQKTLIATAGGDPPDVAGLFDYAVPQFADQGALMPLAELARQAKIDLGAFKPIWLDICQYNDQLFALPSTPYTIALYYNRRLFAEAGLDPDHPPETIAELDEFVTQLTRRDAEGHIVQLGFTTSPAMLGWWHWVWPFFFDGQLWDGKQFNLDTPAGLAAFEWIAKRRDALGVNEVLAFEASAGAIEGSQNPFLAERLAMVFQGPWVSNWVRTYAADLDYGVAPFPSITAQRQNVLASTDVFVIPKGSKHPREAMTFLAFVLQQEVLEGLCTVHCKVSPFQEPGPNFFAGHPNPYIRVFDDLARSADSFGYPKMPMFAEISTEMLFLMESVLRGVRDPKDAVAMTQRKVDSIVGDYQRLATRRQLVASQVE